MLPNLGHLSLSLSLSLSLHFPLSFFIIISFFCLKKERMWKRKLQNKELHTIALKAFLLTHLLTYLLTNLLIHSVAHSLTHLLTSPSSEPIFGIKVKAQKKWIKKSIKRWEIINCNLCLGDNPPTRSQFWF